MDSENRERNDYFVSLNPDVQNYLMNPNDGPDGDLSPSQRLLNVLKNNLDEETIQKIEHNNNGYLLKEVIARLFIAYAKRNPAVYQGLLRHAHLNGRDSDESTIRLDNFFRENAATATQSISTLQGIIAGTSSVAYTPLIKWALEPLFAAFSKNPKMEDLKSKFPENTEGSTEDQGSASGTLLYKGNPRYDIFTSSEDYYNKNFTDDSLKDSYRQQANAFQEHLEHLKDSSASIPFLEPGRKARIALFGNNSRFSGTFANFKKVEGITVNNPNSFDADLDLYSALHAVIGPDVKLEDVFQFKYESGYDENTVKKLENISKKLGFVTELKQRQPGDFEKTASAFSRQQDAILLGDATMANALRSVFGDDAMYQKPSGEFIAESSIPTSDTSLYFKNNGGAYSYLVDAYRNQKSYSTPSYEEIKNVSDIIRNLSGASEATSVASLSENDYEFAKAFVDADRRLQEQDTELDESALTALNFLSPDPEFLLSDDVQVHQNGNIDIPAGLFNKLYDEDRTQDVPVSPDDYDKLLAHDKAEDVKTQLAAQIIDSIDPHGTIKDYFGGEDSDGYKYLVNDIIQTPASSRRNRIRKLRQQIRPSRTKGSVFKPFEESFRWATNSASRVDDMPEFLKASFSSVGRLKDEVALQGIKDSVKRWATVRYVEETHGRRAASEILKDKDGELKDSREKLFSPLKGPSNVEELRNTVDDLQLPFSYKSGLAFSDYYEAEKSDEDLADELRNVVTNELPQSDSPFNSYAGRQSWLSVSALPEDERNQFRHTVASSIIQKMYGKTPDDLALKEILNYKPEGEYNPSAFGSFIREQLNASDSRSAANPGASSGNGGAGNNIPPSWFVASGDEDDNNRGRSWLELIYRNTVSILEKMTSRGDSTPITDETTTIDASAEELPVVDAPELSVINESPIAQVVSEQDAIDNPLSETTASWDSTLSAAIASLQTLGESAGKTSEEIGKVDFASISSDVFNKRIEQAFNTRNLMPARKAIADAAVKIGNLFETLEADSFKRGIEALTESVSSGATDLGEAFKSAITAITPDDTSTGVIDQAALGSQAVDESNPAATEPTEAEESAFNRFTEDIENTRKSLKGFSDDFTSSKGSIVQSLNDAAVAITDGVNNAFKKDTFSEAVTAIKDSLNGVVDAFKGFDISPINEKVRDTVGAIAVPVPQEAKSPFELFSEALKDNEAKIELANGSIAVSHAESITITGSVVSRSGGKRGRRSKSNDEAPDDIRDNETPLYDDNFIISAPSLPDPDAVAVPQESQTEESVDDSDKKKKAAAALEKLERENASRKQASRRSYGSRYGNSSILRSAINAVFTPAGTFETANEAALRGMGLAEHNTALDSIVLSTVDDNNSSLYALSMWEKSNMDIADFADFNEKSKAENLEVGNDADDKFKELQDRFALTISLAGTQISETREKANNEHKLRSELSIFRPLVLNDTTSTDGEQRQLTPYLIAAATKEGREFLGLTDSSNHETYDEYIARAVNIHGYTIEARNTGDELQTLMDMAVAHVRNVKQELEEVSREALIPFDVGKAWDEIEESEEYQALEGNSEAQLDYLDTMLENMRGAHRSHLLEMADKAKELREEYAQAFFSTGLVAKDIVRFASGVDEDSVSSLLFSTPDENNDVAQPNENLISHFYDRDENGNYTLKGRTPVEMKTLDPARKESRYLKGVEAFKRLYDINTEEDEKKLEHVLYNNQPVLENLIANDVAMQDAFASGNLARMRELLAGTTKSVSTKSLLETLTSQIDATGLQRKQKNDSWVGDLQDKYGDGIKSRLVGSGKGLLYTDEVNETLAQKDTANLRKALLDSYLNKPEHQKELQDAEEKAREIFVSEAKSTTEYKNLRADKQRHLTLEDVQDDYIQQYVSKRTAEIDEYAREIAVPSFTSYLNEISYSPNPKLIPSVLSRAVSDYENQQTSQSTIDELVNIGERAIKAGDFDVAELEIDTSLRDQIRFIQDSITNSTDKEKTVKELANTLKVSEQLIRSVSLMRRSTDITDVYDYAAEANPEFIQALFTKKGTQQFRRYETSRKREHQAAQYAMNQMIPYYHLGMGYFDPKFLNKALGIQSNANRVNYDIEVQRVIEGKDYDKITPPMRAFNSAINASILYGSYTDEEKILDAIQRGGGKELEVEYQGVLNGPLGKVTSRFGNFLKEYFGTDIISKHVELFGGKGTIPRKQEEITKAAADISEELEEYRDKTKVGGIDIERYYKAVSEGRVSKGAQALVSGQKTIGEAAEMNVVEAAQSSSKQGFYSKALGLLSTATKWLAGISAIASVISTGVKFLNKAIGSIEKTTNELAKYSGPTGQIVAAHQARQFFRDVEYADATKNERRSFYKEYDEYLDSLNELKKIWAGTGISLTEEGVRILKAILDVLLRISPKETEEEKRENDLEGKLEESNKNKPMVADNDNAFATTAVMGEEYVTPQEYLSAVENGEDITTRRGKNIEERFKDTTPYYDRKKYGSEKAAREIAISKLVMKPEVAKQTAIETLEDWNKQIDEINKRKIVVDAEKQAGIDKRRAENAAETQKINEQTRKKTKEIEQAEKNGQDSKDLEISLNQLFDKERYLEKERNEIEAEQTNLNKIKKQVVPHYNIPTSEELGRRYSDFSNKAREETAERAHDTFLKNRDAYVYGKEGLLGGRGKPKQNTTDLLISSGLLGAPADEPATVKKRMKGLYFDSPEDFDEYAEYLTQIPPQLFDKERKYREKREAEITRKKEEKAAKEAERDKANREKLREHRERVLEEPWAQTEPQTDRTFSFTERPVVGRPSDEEFDEYIELQRTKFNSSEDHLENLTSTEETNGDRTFKFEATPIVGDFNGGKKENNASSEDDSSWLDDPTWGRKSRPQSRWQNDAYETGNSPVGTPAGQNAYDIWNRRYRRNADDAIPHPDDVRQQFVDEYEKNEDIINQAKLEYANAALLDYIDGKIDYDELNRDGLMREGIVRSLGDVYERATPSEKALMYREASLAAFRMHNENVRRSQLRLPLIDSQDPEYGQEYMDFSGNFTDEKRVYDKIKGQRAVYDFATGKVEDITPEFVAGIMASDELSDKTKRNIIENGAEHRSSLQSFLLKKRFYDPVTWEFIGTINQAEARRDNLKEFIDAKDKQEKVNSDILMDRTDGVGHIDRVTSDKQKQGWSFVPDTVTPDKVAFGGVNPDEWIGYTPEELNDYAEFVRPDVKDKYKWRRKTGKEYTENYSERSREFRETMTEDINDAYQTYSYKEQLKEREFQKESDRADGNLPRWKEVEYDLEDEIEKAKKKVVPEIYLSPLTKAGIETESSLRGWNAENATSDKGRERIEANTKEFDELKKNAGDSRTFKEWSKTHSPIEVINPSEERRLKSKNFTRGADYYRALQDYKNGIIAKGGTFGERELKDFTNLWGEYEAELRQKAGAKLPRETEQEDSKFKLNKAAWEEYPMFWTSNAGFDKKNIQSEIETLNKHAEDAGLNGAVDDFYSVLYDPTNPADLDNYARTRASVLGKYEDQILAWNFDKDEIPMYQHNMAKREMKRRSTERINSHRKSFLDSDEKKDLIKKEREYLKKQLQALDVMRKEVVTGNFMPYLITLEQFGALGNRTDYSNNASKFNIPDYSRDEQEKEPDIQNDDEYGVPDWMKPNSAEEELPGTNEEDDIIESSVDNQDLAMSALSTLIGEGNRINQGVLDATRQMAATVGTRHENSKDYTAEFQKLGEQIAAASKREPDTRTEIIDTSNERHRIHREWV